MLIVIQVAHHRRINGVGNMLSLLQKYPNCAKPATTCEDTYHDIDQQAACLVGHDQTYHQISAGCYEGWFKTVELGSHLSLYFETFNQTLEQWGAVPDGYNSFVLLMDGSSPCRIGSNVFDTSGIIYLTPKADFDFHALPGTKYCVVSIKADFFKLFFCHCAGKQFTDFFCQANTTLDTNPLRAQTLRQMVYQGLEMAVNHADSGMITGYQISIASLLAGYMSDAMAGDPDKTHHFEPPKLALVARNYIRDTADSYTNVSSLAFELGVSRRSLETAFRIHFDISPAEYIRLFKLNKIRLALKSKENDDRTIGDIAADFGVWHLGRLAQNYKKQFGELPSRTRQPLSMPH